VHKNELNAITQYFSFVYFEELEGKEEELKQKILNFFEENCKEPLSNFESYVVRILIRFHHQVE
jgi:hypothetical protein